MSSYLEFNWFICCKCKRLTNGISVYSCLKLCLSKVSRFRNRDIQCESSKGVKNAFFLKYNVTISVSSYEHDGFFSWNVQSMCRRLSNNSFYVNRFTGAIYTAI